MANISHETVLSAAWMLMRRAREAGSASNGSDASNRDSAGSDEGCAKETLKNLISAYLRPATDISSHFHCW